MIKIFKQNKSKNTKVQAHLHSFTYLIMKLLRNLFLLNYECRNLDYFSRFLKNDFLELRGL